MGDDTVHNEQLNVVHHRVRAVEDAELELRRSRRRLVKAREALWEARCAYHDAVGPAFRCHPTWLVTNVNRAWRYALKHPESIAFFSLLSAGCALAVLVAINKLLTGGTFG